MTGGTHLRMDVNRCFPSIDVRLSDPSSRYMTAVCSEPQSMEEYVHTHQRSKAVRKSCER